VTINTQRKPAIVGRVHDIDEAMAEIEKGQQLAGHYPDADALDRARRILIGELTEDEAYAEVDAKYPAH
jgi:hypothetical protein